MSSFFKKYHYLILICIIAFAFFTRIARVHLPEKYVFDEVYHALTAKLISRNDPRAFEWWNPAIEKDTAVDWLHPPLAKYTQAFFIGTFGENTFGWRISSVLFGTLVIIAVYKLSEELFADKNLSLLAAFLASLDGLLLVQSRIAMNDIHVTFFILLTLIFYLRYRKLPTKKLLFLVGLSAGLAIASKWSGVFVLLIVLFWEKIDFLKKLRAPKQTLKKHIKHWFLIFFALIVLPIAVYVASYAQMFSQGKTLFCNQQAAIRNECYFEKIQIGPWQWQGYISHFSELHRQTWHYQTNLKATHSYQSRPWQWVFNLRPVWLDVDYGGNKIGNIYAQGNTALFLLGDLAILTSLLSFTLVIIKKLAPQLLKKFKLKKAALKIPFNLIILLFAYFMVWLPWQLSPRIMFFYHYTPAVPLLAIILAYWLIRLNRVTIKIGKNKKYPLGKILLSLSLLACALNFIIFYPNWTLISVPKEFADTIYFALKTWK
jgi:dolichyl-phosphate-mannose-protein mannosyltransferase